MDHQYNYIKQNALKGGGKITETYEPGYETKIPKLQYKIVLRSVDRVNTTDSTSSCLFNVRLPRITSKLVKMIVKSMVFTNSVSGNSTNSAFSVHIKELTNRNSYHSYNSGPTNQICQTMGYDLINTDPYLGYMLLDSSQLLTSQLTVYLNDISKNLDPSGTLSTNLNNNWSLEMVLIEV